MSIVLHKYETELIRIETNGIDVLTVNIMAMRLRRAAPPGGGFNRVLAEDEDSSPGGYDFLTKKVRYVGLFQGHFGRLPVVPNLVDLD